MNVFHLAYTVTDLDSARRFYGEFWDAKRAEVQILGLTLIFLAISYHFMSVR